MQFPTGARCTECSTTFVTGFAEVVEGAAAPLGSIISRWLCRRCHR
jgi:hypothetical protein